MNERKTFLPKKVHLREVGFRDGLQSETTLLSIEEKIELIEAIVDAGARSVEIGAFLHVVRVPTMAETGDVARRLVKREGVEYSAFAPNLKGIKRAYVAGVMKVKVVAPAYRVLLHQSRKPKTSEVIENFGPCVIFCRRAGMAISGAISMAFGYVDPAAKESGCQGIKIVPLERLETIVRAYGALGMKELTIADSEGVANPKQVYEYMSMLRSRHPDVALTLCVHNARGMALANILAGLAAGITRFDTSFAGLGGFPRSINDAISGAASVSGILGKAATEDVVNMMHSMGIETGYDLAKTAAVARRVEAILGHPGYGRVSRLQENIQRIETKSLTLE